MSDAHSGDSGNTAVPRAPSVERRPGAHAGAVSPQNPNARHNNYEAKP